MAHEPIPVIDERALPAAHAVLAALDAALGSDLVAVYAHGSAALGGFEPSVSDLDLLVVCEAPLDDMRVDALRDALANLGPGAGLPARGLELSVLTRAEAAEPTLGGPRYQVHVVIGPDRRLRAVDGRVGSTDRDLVLHLAVCRARGVALRGPSAPELLADVPGRVALAAMIDEVDWALGAAPLEYLVLTAARAAAFAATGRLVSKVEAASMLPGPGHRDVVGAALAVQRGAAAAVDPDAARRFAAEVSSALRLALADPSTGRGR